jgi:hypothetical protein
MGTNRIGTPWKHRFLHALGMSLVLIALTACGGATTSVQTNPVSSAISSVSPACTPSTVAATATSQCSATVMGTGSYSSAVTWSASAGTINSSGLFTAPAMAATATVTATSTQDSTKSGTASVTVKAPSSTITSVQAACNPSTVIATATSQCTATVKGTGSYSSAVTWSASVGGISSGGLFTAPATTGAATITATSVQDTAQSGQATVTVQSPPPPPQTRHIVMVMEENTGYASVVGNSNWSNLNSLISNGALATNFYADSHPSIGNYFMLTTGQLLTTDDNSTTVWNVDNLARRMLAAGIPFRIYAEGITQGYVGGNMGTYLIRHNPFAMLSDIANNPTVANQTIWPFTQFATDLANGTLPVFSFVVPDVDDDAHNGTPQQADSWLQMNIVTPLSNYPAFQSGGDGVLIVAFDEAASSDTTNGGGHVPAIFWGPVAKVGFTQTSSTLYQHQSILLTVMDTLGLPNPPGAAATAPSMSEFLK